MRRTIAALLASGLLVAAGCGGDDEDGGGGAADTQQAPARTIDAPQTDDTDVKLTDFSIDPPTPTVKAGKVTFAVTNDGDAPHALEIEGDGVEFETEVLQAGGKADLDADLEAGEYEWYCPVGNHAELGMKGKLTVE